MDEKKYELVLFPGKPLPSTYQAGLYALGSAPYVTDPVSYANHTTPGGAERDCLKYARAAGFDVDVTQVTRVTHRRHWRDWLAGLAPWVAELLERGAARGEKESTLERVGNLAHAAGPTFRPEQAGEMGLLELMARDERARKA